MDIKCKSSMVINNITGTIKVRIVRKLVLDILRRKKRLEH